MSNIAASRDHAKPVPAGELPGLTLRGIRKAFGATLALADASVDCHAGEVHGILGENGAGKSTLVKILAGTVIPDAGTISLRGEAVSIASVRDSLRNGIRVVFQEMSTIGDLTVAENMMFSSSGSVWRGRQGRIRHAAAELIEGLGCRPLDVRARVREISLADRQLLEVLKAVQSSPDVLILDEATSALGPEDTAWVLGCARKLADSGGVVLFISHRMPEIRSITDRGPVLRAGTQVLEAPVKSVTDDQLTEAMLGRPLKRFYPERSAVPGDEIQLQVNDLRMRGIGPLSFDARVGEIVGLWALPGQGQREIMLALAGAQPFRGHVVVGGRRYAPRSPGNAIRAGVVLVPEDRQREGLFSNLTTLANETSSTLTSLRGRTRLVSSRLERSTGEEISDRLGIRRSALEFPINRLSGGNQQKAILARALLTGPKLLLLYDCTRGVDVGTKADIYELLSGLAASGTTVLMYSTDMDEMVNTCNRVIVIGGGKILGIVEGSDITGRQVLALALGASVDGQEAEHRFEQA